MKNSNRVLFVKQIADWQPIAIEEDEKLGYNQGIYVSGDFVNLDMFVRYGTPWIGDAPTFYAQGGEVIGITNMKLVDDTVEGHIVMPESGGDHPLQRRGDAAVGGGII